MHLKAQHKADVDCTGVTARPSLPTMTTAQVYEYVRGTEGACVVVIDNAIVSIETYLEEHVRPASCFLVVQLTIIYSTAWGCLHPTQILPQTPSR